MKFTTKKMAIILSIAIFMTSINVYADDIHTEDFEFDTILNQNDEIAEQVDMHEDIDMHDSNSSTINLDVPKKTKSISTKNINLSDYKVDSAVTNETITLSCYDDKTYLSNVNTYRGDQQMRGVIPYVLKAGETIVIRQTEGAGQQNFFVELKPGYRDYDVSSTISSDGSYATATANLESVIYIRMNRVKFSDVTFEYSITKATSMPIYKHNVTDTSTFFEQWDALGTKFAVLESDVVVLQIPDINKESLRNIGITGHFNDIDHVLDYYQEMIDFFDYSYGLDGSTNYNFNPNQRYLAIPELVNSTTVGTYTNHLVRAYGATTGMLRMIEDSWLPKHEFAHGYQGDMMDYDVKVREIWNNIPAHYYSMVTNSNYKKYATDYNNNKPKNQMAVYNKSVTTRANNSAPSYDLNFFREIFDQYGLDVFIKFNQEYRRLGIKKEHNIIMNSDQFAKLFSRYAEVDLVPYFLSFNAVINNSIIEGNVELPKAYYLTEIVKDQELKNYVISKYNLVTEYSIVDTSIFGKDSKLSSLTGDVSVNISIDDYEQLKGKQVLLKNGDIEIISEIQDGVAIFKNVPVGVYNVLMPLTNNGNYFVDAQKYLIVSEDSVNNISTIYTENKYFHLNMLYNFTIRSNSNYTALTADIFRKNANDYVLNISTLAGRLNGSIGNNDLYAYFKVLDDNGNVVYNHEFYNATSSIASSEKISIKNGYQIHLYRNSAYGYSNRKFFKNIIKNEEYRDTSSQLLIFDVTENGIIYRNNENMVKITDIVDSYTSGDSSAYFENASRYIYTSERDDLENVNQYIYTSERADLENANLYLDEITSEQYIAKNTQRIRKNNPIITINAENVELNIGDDYDLINYVSAFDIEDGDLTDKVEVNENNFDINEVGEYSIDYRILDSDYNYAKAKIVVKVVNNKMDTDEDSDIVDNTDGGEDIDIVDDTDEGENTDIVDDTDVDDEPEILDNPTDSTDETDNDTAIPETDNTDKKPPVIEKESSNNSNNSNKNEKPKEKIQEKETIESAKPESEHVYVSNNTILKNRKPYDIYKIDVSYLGLGSTIPYYYNENLEKQFIKFSSIDNNIVSFINISGDTVYYGRNNKSFTDVTNNWAKESIDFVSSRDILNGVSEEKFSPKTAVSRAMLVTTLGRMSNENINGYPNMFFDVENGKWYTNYISWAKAKNIVDGIDENNFNPNGDVTREQLAVILYNFLENTLHYEIANNNNELFIDDSSISSWAIEPIYILRSTGIIYGDSQGNFNPKYSLTREELSAIIMRLVKYVLESESNFM